MKAASVLAQRGGNLVHLLLRQLQRQGAGLDLRGDVHRFFLGITAGDAAGSVHDRLVDGGIDQRFIVQGDLDIPADVFGRGIRKEGAAFVRQLKGDDMLAVLVGIDSALDLVALHDLVSVRIQETHLGGGADQVQHGIVLHVRDLNTDSVHTDALHIGFGVVLVRQTGPDDGHCALHQVIKAGF